MHGAVAAPVCLTRPVLSLNISADRAGSRLMVQGVEGPVSDSPMLYGETFCL